MDSQVGGGRAPARSSVTTTSTTMPDGTMMVESVSRTVNPNGSVTEKIKTWSIPRGHGAALGTGALMHPSEAGAAAAGMSMGAGGESHEVRFADEPHPPGAAVPPTVATQPSSVEGSAPPEPGLPSGGGGGVASGDQPPERRCSPRARKIVLVSALVVIFLGVVGGGVAVGITQRDKSGNGSGDADDAASKEKVLSGPEGTCDLDGTDVVCFRDNATTLSLCFDESSARDKCSAFVADTDERTNYCCTACAFCPGGCKFEVSYDCTNLSPDFRGMCDCPGESTDPTPSPPTPPPTAAGSASEVQAAFYQVEWFGDSDENCTLPQPGISVTCGVGGKPIILDDSGTGQCSIQSDAIRCSIFENETFMGLVYACEGRTTTAWTTRAEVLTDDSVACTSTGLVGDFVFLARLCPGVEGMDSNSMMCDPPRATEISSTTNDTFCVTVGACQVVSGCAGLSIPSVASYVPESEIETSCLFDPDPTPSPPTPPPSSLPAAPPTIRPTLKPTPKPTAAGSASSEVWAALYQVDWFGDSEENCTVPRPGISVTCGVGGEPIIVDNSGTGQCSVLSDAIGCSIFENETSMALLYACEGQTTSAWTTRAEVLTGDSVTCTSTGAAMDFVFLAQACVEGEELELDYNSMMCDPPQATQVSSTTNDTFCLVGDACQVLSGCAELSIPSVASYVPESEIETSCLYAAN